MPLKPYVVKQGDFLAKLAHAMNFVVDEVWKDPKNAELAGKRDPNLLLPGDLLWVPDAPPDPAPVQGGSANNYSATVPTTTIVIILSNDAGPIANEPYTVGGLASPQAGTTDATGKLTIEVPVTLRECEVLLTKRNLLYPVRIGDMDPIEDPAGVRKRLQHLGHRGHDHEGIGDELKEAKDAIALVAFQDANDLPLTGAPDDATVAALLKAHGS